ncbi:NAD-dependent epimerase/dehydratase family protein [Azospirillum sp. TSH100]|uniref:NAD-dependent epimerase/dehydratase family protein n=2 Tax=Azospirillum sp. TSH100 TaxID=652764 RepID=UPI0010AA00BE|nr:NAD-dependent epimerase/dehydratase family protein [Azospirillum sp. TSH100]QCG89528.1 NAD-dependent epimerase/dehydratase family protein [Azospirillum sp. TSH100]
MARYLVTGGCGFIGSHLIERLLAAGHEVRVLDDLSTGKRENLPDGVPVTIGDVADAEVVRAAMSGEDGKGVDGCFHLAAVASVDRSREAWLETHHANLSGTIAVFDAARHANPAGPVPVIYASSAAVYGDNPDMPLSEDAATRPLSAYGADKLGCELHARVADGVHGVPTAGFRFFNVYGPRQDPKSPYSGVISIFAGRIARGEPITVNGDGEQVRDFIFVKDLVRYLTAAMGHPQPGAPVYNVCTGRPTSVNRLAEVLAELSGRPLDRRYGPARPGDIRMSIGDPTRLIAAFGMSCDTPLEDGLRQTLAWLD